MNQTQKKNFEICEDMNQVNTENINLQSQIDELTETKKLNKEAIEELKQMV